MQRRDIGLMLVGAAVAAAILGNYQWRSGQRPDALTGAAAPVSAPPNATPPLAAPADAGAPAPQRSLAVPSVADSTAKLAARLQKSGGSAADWQLLGKSYDFLGMKPEADAAYARGGGRPAAAAAAAEAAPAMSAPAGARISGSVDIAPRLRASLPANAVLFIYAKSAVLAGPPVASVKLAAKDWPVAFTLDDGNAMMPGLTLSGAEKVVVEARISRSGNALAEPGDLTGSVANIDPRRAKPLRIVIDHAVQKAR